MQISIHHRLRAEIDLILALTLGGIALGSGLLFWEWHSAHPGKEKHSGGGVATHHHHQG